MNAPIAMNDVVETQEDQLIIIDVLGNDTDSDNDALTISSAFSVNGTLVINEDGTISYTPNENYNGLDTITYEVSDGNGGFDTAIVTVNVVAVNDAPNAVADAYTVNAGHNANVTYIYGAYTNNVLVNDNDAEGDAFSMTAVNGQALVDGVAIVNGDNGGVFTVSENGMVHLDASTGFESLLVGESTTTSFTYTITDANGASSTATTTITVNGQNEAPEAENDNFTVSSGSSEILSNSVLANDSDPDGDTLVITSVNGEALTDGSVLVQGDNDGWFTVYEDGTIDFDSSTGFDSLASGESSNTSVEYTVTDTDGNSDTAVVTVLVENDYMA